MKRGPCDGVKGAVDAYDLPLEARVPRLDRCCLKQKVGYSRDTAPKKTIVGIIPEEPPWRTRTLQKLYGFYFSDLFLSEPSFRRISSRQACYWLVSCFSIRLFSLGISVEYHALEFMGLDPG
jgi:hypothetical protein